MLDAGFAEYLRAFTDGPATASLADREGGRRQPYLERSLLPAVRPPRPTTFAPSMCPPSCMRASAANDGTRALPGRSAMQLQERGHVAACMAALVPSLLCPQRVYPLEMRWLDSLLGACTWILGTCYIHHEADCSGSSLLCPQTRCHMGWGGLDSLLGKGSDACTCPIRHEIATERDADWACFHMVFHPGTCCILHDLAATERDAESAPAARAAQAAGASGEDAEAWEAAEALVGVEISNGLECKLSCTTSKVWRACSLWLV